jgi:hypothetical protein
MEGQVLAPSPASLPQADIPAEDGRFFSLAATILERLEAESKARGHVLLASLLGFAKVEAEYHLAPRSEELWRSSQSFSDDLQEQPDTAEAG